MSFAAVFGRNPALSTAELWALGQAHGFDVQPLGRFGAALSDTFELPVADRLGATTKVVELADDTAPDAETAVKRLVGGAPSDGKVTFGISAYGKVSASSLTKLALGAFAARGVKTRYIAKHEGKTGGGELSAVQVHHNKLVRKGFDWCVFETSEGWRYGRTVWVYDFAGFARRDYDKPASDTKRGMLPPQLARTMVNLSAQKTETVADPFCGVGNLVMESVLLGHATVGTDIDAAAIKDAERNLAWLRAETSALLLVADATKPSTWSADAIATEGYLGSLIRQSMNERQIEQEIEDVERIMTAFLRSGTDGVTRVVLTLPAWRLSSGELRRLRLVERVEEFGYTKVRPLPPEWRLPGLTPRDTIDVARPKQRIVHELLILEKNNVKD